MPIDPKLDGWIVHDYRMTKLYLINGASARAIVFNDRCQFNPITVGG